MFALLTNARMNNIDWSVSEASGWYMYNFASVMNMALPKSKAAGCKRGCRGNELPGAEHLLVVLRNVMEFCESGMKLDFAEAVWNRFQTEGADLRVTPCIYEQHAFVRDTAGSRNKIEGDANYGRADWDIKRMM